MALTKPNYTQIPNEILDSLMYNLSGSELKILLTICRKTFGWHKDSDGISITQMIELTGLGRTQIIESISSLEQKDIITAYKKTGKTTIYSIKIKSEPVQKVNQTSSESEPDKGLTSSESEPTKESIIKETNKKNIYTQIFNFWNQSENLQKHNNILTFTNKFSKNKLKQILKEYTIEDIEQAIKNYNYVLGHSEYHYFTYKWTLWDFLTRGLDKFVPSACPLVNFKKKKESKEKSYQEQVAELYGG